MGFLAEFRRVAAADELARNTVDVYTCWLKAFAAFTGKGAAQWTGRDVGDFIHDMHRRDYSGSARKQALCAIVYGFKKVLKVDPGLIDLPPLPREKKKIKVIPTRDELDALFSHLKGRDWLMAQLLYGAMLRVSEVCTLRVKDIDFGNGKIDVHQGKGDKDRKTWLPRRLVDPLQRWIAHRAQLHAWDLGQGHGAVEMPGRLARKYPSASRELPWQWLFPSQVIREGYRWHTTPESIQKAIGRAVRDAGILKIITPHTLRHAGASHGLRTPGNDIRTVSDALGHSHLETTEIYIHADSVAGTSPLDAPPAAPALPPPRRQYLLRHP